MKKLVIYILLTAIPLCLVAEESLVDKKELENRLNFMKENVVPLKSDSIDHDFDDLMPLKEKIGDSRIVMIGEESHGHGSSMVMKARLVRFLHEEMGFNILAWESNIHQCELMNKWFKDEETIGIKAARKGIFGVWSSTQQVFPLFDYIKKSHKTDNPLIQVGFDIRLSGNLKYEELGEDLINFLKVAAPPEELLEDIRSIYKEAEDINRYKENEEVTGRNVDRALRVNDFIVKNKEKLIEKHDERTYGFYDQVNSSMFHMMKLNQVKYNGIRGFEYRDEYMAENLKFIIDKYYPEEKIIVWAASGHIARETPKLENYILSQVKVMGCFIHEAYKNDIYSIGFLSQQGKTYWVGNRMEMELKPASEGTLEHYFGELGHDYAFLDFKHHDGTPFIYDSLPGRFFSPREISSTWNEIFDGVIYLKQASGVDKWEDPEAPQKAEKAKSGESDTK